MSAQLPLVFWSQMPVITAPADSVSHLDTPDCAELFPIREVARLTGVNPVTLRAWERRYGLIQPTRTESGHRLYSKADIETVHRILDWIERGVAVSKVGKILARDDQQAEAVRAERDVVEEGEWSQWQARLMQVVSDFDDRQLDRLYGQVLATYPLDVVFQDILMPLWNELLRHQGVSARPANGCSLTTSCGYVPWSACNWRVLHPCRAYCWRPWRVSAVSWSCWWRRC